ncbi:MAG: hypothetical protein FWB93_07015 [Oscillospiraceae bacterium]|nr:hypothetical protein [Oscillospiraceae bacterium]
MIKPATKPAHMVRKLIAFQIGVTVFGMFNGLVFGGGDLDTLILVITIIAIGMHMVMVATSMYEYGQVDRVRISTKRDSEKPFRGFNIALVANSLNIALGVIAVISKLFIENVGFFEYAAEDVVVNPAFFGELHAISAGLTAMIQMGYFGLYNLYLSGNPLFFLIIPFPSVIVAGVAYRMGLNSHE